MRQMLDDMTAMVAGRRRDRARAARGAAGARADHGAVLGAVARRRRRVAVVLQHEHRGPAHRRPQPRRRVPPGHDRRRPPLPRAAAVGARLPTSGFQVLAGAGLTPRRMAAYVSDTDLAVDADGRVRASCSPPTEPSAAELGGGAVGADARRTPRPSSCASTSPTAPPRSLAELDHRAARPARRSPRCRPTTGRRPAAHRHGLDDRQARDAPPHHPSPSCSTSPTSSSPPRPPTSAPPTPPPTTSTCSARSGSPTARRSSSTSPRPPPATGASPSRTSGTSASTPPAPQLAHQRPRRLAPSDDGTVRVVVAATDPGVPNWLDTGRRHRGFVTLRWLDNPAAPDVTTSVQPVADLTP